MFLQMLDQFIFTLLHTKQNTVCVYLVNGVYDSSAATQVGVFKVYTPTLYTGN